MSWYLRLRDGHGVDPEFGLIRVEISKAYIQEAAVQADKFSRSLLSRETAHIVPSSTMGQAPVSDLWMRKLPSEHSCRRSRRFTAVMQG